jgi:hypothetical protein
MEFGAPGPTQVRRSRRMCLILVTLNVRIRPIPSRKSMRAQGLIGLPGTSGNQQTGKTWNPL